MLDVRRRHNYDMSPVFGNGEVVLRFNHVGRRLRRDLLDDELPEFSRVLTSSVTLSSFYLEGVTTKLGIRSLTDSMLMKLEFVVLWEMVGFGEGSSRLVVRLALLK